MPTYTLTPNAVGRARRILAKAAAPEPRLYISATTPRPLTGLQPPSVSLNPPTPTAPAEFTGPKVGTWAATGTSSLVTAMNDSSDSTYVRKTSTGGSDMYTWAMGTFSLPKIPTNWLPTNPVNRTSEVVVRFRWRIRQKRPLSTSGFTAYFFTNAVFADTANIPKDAVFGSQAVTGAATTTAWVEGPWVAWTNTSVREMPQAQIDDLNLVIVDQARSTAAASYFYEAQIVVETTKRPRVNITSQGGAYSFSTVNVTSNVVTLTTDVPHNIPSGASIKVENIMAAFDGTYTVTSVTSNTIVYSKTYANVDYTNQNGRVRLALGTETGSTRPLVEWETYDVDGDAQTAYDIFVYDSATVTAWGTSFVPGVVLSKNGARAVPYVWRYRSQDARQVDTAMRTYLGKTLTSGSTYRVAVRAYSYPGWLGNPTATNGVASEWNWVDFTMNAEGLPTPVLNALPNTSIGGVRVYGYGRVNLLCGPDGILRSGSDTISPQTQTVDNALFNGGTGAWEQGGAITGTVALVASPARTGAGSMRWTVGTASTGGPWSAMHPVNPGGEFTASAWVRAATVNRSARILIYWYGAGDINTSIASFTGASATTTTSGWTQITATTVAPANAVYGRMWVQFVTPSAGEQFYIDDASFTPGDTALTDGLGAYTTQGNLIVEATGIGNLAPARWGRLVSTSTNFGVAASAQNSRSGTGWRLRKTTSSPSSGEFKTPEGVAGIPVAGSAPVSFACWVVASGGSGTFTLYVDSYTEAGTFISSLSASASLTAGVGAKVSGSGTLPSTAAYVSMRFNHANMTDMTVDDIFLSYGSGIDPDIVGYTPPRVRRRIIPWDPRDGIIDYVDEGAPVDSLTIYRFQCVGEDSGSAPVWDVVSFGGTPQWSLRVLSAPEHNYTGFTVLGDLDETRDEQTEAYWTLGSDYPTVLSTALGGADGSLEIRCATELEWRKLVDVLTSKSTLVLHAPITTARGAEPKFIRVTGQKWTTEKYESRIYRTANIDYVEVEPY